MLESLFYRAPPVAASKVLDIKCASVTGIAKGIVIAHNSRCLLLRHGDGNHPLSRCSVNLKHFNPLEPDVH